MLLFHKICIMGKTKRIFLGILMLTLSLMASAQLESQLTFRRFNTQDGLPQMQTERLWQDSRGYIYIGTLSGFARYDGRTFTPFLKGRRFNIVGFAEVDGVVRAFDFRRAWFTSLDKVEAQPIDPQGGRLLNNFNSPMLPDGFILLEDEQEQHRRLCRLTAQGLECIEKSPMLDQMTPDRKLFLDTAKCEIIINRDMPEESQRETLIHEMVHGMLVHMGCDDLNNDEKFVQQMAVAIGMSFDIKGVRDDEVLIESDSDIDREKLAEELFGLLKEMYEETHDAV